MSINKKIGIVVLVIILAIAGYFGYQAMNTPAAEIKTVETTEITKEDNTIVLNGKVESSESKTFVYDYETYGKLWSTHVVTGQYVSKDDVIVESSKKDYKAPFDGYIVELDVDAAYNQAKRAYDDKEIIEMPLSLYTIANSDYYIQTEMTEYEINRLPENRVVTYSVRANDIEQEFAGSIRQISGQPSQSATSDISTYKVIINIDGGKETTRLGNHVTIRIKDGNEKPIIIPESSVLTEGEETSVYVVERLSAVVNHVSKRKVTVEKQEDGQYKVLEGLIDGEAIVTNDVTTLVDGESVVIKGDIEETTIQQAA